MTLAGAGLVGLALAAGALPLPSLDLSGWVLFLGGALLGTRRGGALGVTAALLAWGIGHASLAAAAALALHPVLGAWWQGPGAETLPVIPRPVLAGLLGGVLGAATAAAPDLLEGAPVADAATLAGILGFLLYGTTVWWAVTPIDELRERWGLRG